MANKRKGKVTSLGPKQDRPGVYVRVVIDTALPNNSSSVHGSGSAKTTKAIWVPMHSVEKVIESMFVCTFVDKSFLFCFFLFSLLGFQFVLFVFCADNVV